MTINDNKHYFLDTKFGLDRKDSDQDDFADKDYNSEFAFLEFESRPRTARLGETFDSDNTGHSRAINDFIAQQLFNKTSYDNDLTPEEQEIARHIREEAIDILNPDGSQKFFVRDIVSIIPGILERYDSDTDGNLGIDVTKTDITYSAGELYDDITNDTGAQYGLIYADNAILYTKALAETKNVNISDADIEQIFKITAGNDGILDRNDFNSAVVLLNKKADPNGDPSAGPLLTLDPNEIQFNGKNSDTKGNDYTYTSNGTITERADGGSIYLSNSTIESDGIDALSGRYTEEVLGYIQNKLLNAGATLDDLDALNIDDIISKKFKPDGKITPEELTDILREVKTDASKFTSLDGVEKNIDVEFPGLLIEDSEKSGTSLETFLQTFTDSDDATYSDAELEGTKIGLIDGQIDLAGGKLIRPLIQSYLEDNGVDNFDATEIDELINAALSNLTKDSSNLNSDGTISAKKIIQELDKIFANPETEYDAYTGQETDTDTDTDTSSVSDATAPVATEYVVNEDSINLLKKDLDRQDTAIGSLSNGINDPREGRILNTYEQFLNANNLTETEFNQSNIDAFASAFELDDNQKAKIEKLIEKKYESE